MIAWDRLSAVKPYQVVMAGVFASALAAGWGMLPGDDVRIAMLERDGHSREALALLDEAYQSGDRSYRTLHQMAALHENEGNVERTGQILSQMVVQRPRDIALRRRLTKFYRDTQDASGLSSALKAEIEVRYSEAACRELISNHRLAGRYDDEKAALQSCRQSGYRRPDDLSRLAELLAAGGDTTQAASILRSIDDVKRLKDARERFQLLAFLLEEKQPKEAERRALRWIRSEKDDSFAVGVIDMFAQSDFPSSAIELAKSAGEAGDSIALTVAERLLEQSQAAAARLYLRGWLESAGTLDEATAIRFIEAAVEAVDPKTAFAGAKKLGLQKLPVEVALKLAHALRAAGLKDEVKEALAVLPSEPELQLSDAAAPAPAPPAVSDSATSKSGNTAMSGNSRIAAGDPLLTWRRTMLARVTGEAEQKAYALGYQGFRPRVLNRNEGRPASRAHASSKVLKKTARVLQRTKKLRSLKQKKKLVQQKSPSGRAAVSAPAPVAAPKPVQKPVVNP